MTDDIEQRLTTAAEAAREREVTTRRSEDLRHRITEATRQLDTLRAGLGREERDVARLEGLSLTRLLLTLRGDRNDALARERAAAEAARYRVAETEGRLATMRAEYAEVQARLTELAGAAQQLAGVLDEKEEYLRASGDPRQGQLLELAGERGRLAAELREIDEARHAADAAGEALEVVRTTLDSASNWSTYDTFVSNDLIGGVLKQSRLDEAAQAAAEADRRLAVLRTELTDLGGTPDTAAPLALDQLTRFVDIWFDNVFTDLAVADKIQQAQHNVQQSARMVAELRDRLVQRATVARARLAEIEVERRALLVGR